MNKIKYSVIIGTLNHCEDLLKPCLESIKKYTDLSDVEVIVVSNGSTDNTREYVENLGEPFKLLWFDKPLGYPKANNEGAKVATGKYLIFLNNDTVLLPQAQNEWLDRLEKPFKEDIFTGVVGPSKKYSEETDKNFIIFFLAMTKKSIAEQVAVYEEI